MSKDYIWYCSYGSNLKLDRFLCYILGGTPKGSSKCELGCRDKTLPIKNKPIKINNELIFVENSARWSNMGVAVVNPKINIKMQTYGRMYLITKEQFIDVVKQENGIILEKAEQINFSKNQKGNSSVLLSDKRYGLILCVGQDEGYPIYTFTSSKDIKAMQVNTPSKEYLQMIASGLVETYNLSEDELANYFLQFKGVKNSYSYEQLIKLFS
jgi:hypothetical protein